MSWEVKQSLGREFDTSKLTSKAEEADSSRRRRKRQ
jgi:hypothetical protein